MTRFVVRVEGPVFSKAAPLEVQRTLRVIIQELVELGEQHLDTMLRPRPGGVFLSVSQAGKGKASRGNYRRNVHGEMKSDTRGIINDSGVIYGPWLEGVGTRNQTTRFKGYASFRRTGQWLDDQKKAVAEVHLAGLAKRLGGE